jgi:glycosyltransferase involved in cell wall biosynthesis
MNPEMKILALFPKLTAEWDLLANIRVPGVILKGESVQQPAPFVMHELRTASRKNFGRAVSDGLKSFKPDIVIFGTGLNFRTAWQAWLAKRAVVPGSLAVAIQKSDQATTGNWILRETIRFGLIDAVLFLSKSECPDPRWRTIAAKKRWPADRHAVQVQAFLEERLRAERKSILWVDPNVSTRSPSMRSLVCSAEYLRGRGWEIRTWCVESDLENEKTVQVFLPRLPGPASLKLFWFFIMCNAFGLVHRCLIGRKPAAVIQTTCANFLGADICAVHFCNRHWLELSRALPDLSISEQVKLLVHRLGAQLESLQLKSSTLRLLLPVSSGIGEAIKRFYGSQTSQTVLPNSYDHDRFSPEARRRYRECMREELSFGPEDKVLAFTSYGHYHRKGFWLIIDALKHITAADISTPRLLVIGGMPKAIKRLQDRLKTRLPNWSTQICFVGPQNQVERYLAAADAFIFPSYYEAALSLAEIEAGAMGLPLFVTPHPGTEGLQVSGINGVWLALDGKDIAQKIINFMRGEYSFQGISVGEALTQQDYASRLHEIYNSIIENGQA